MNVAETHAMKARIAALEARIDELYRILSPQNDQVSAGGQSQNPTLAVKRGPGRPRKEPEAA